MMNERILQSYQGESQLCERTNTGRLIGACTPETFAQYLEEQPLARLGPYLPEAGSLNQDEFKPFGPDLVTGLGQRHPGDATPPFDSLGIYDAGAVIDMNNLVIGLTPYLPPYRD